MRTISAVLALAASLVAAGTTGTVGSPVCTAAAVHYTPYPGGDRRLDRIPWISAGPAAKGLVGLLWYWPESWRKQRLRRAQIFTHGQAPAGYSTKVLWAWTGPAARDRGGALLVVSGRRLDGPGSFRQEFSAIGYEGQDGAPSYASIVDVPKPGCWRLTLATTGLRAEVVVRAVSG